MALWSPIENYIAVSQKGSQDAEFLTYFGSLIVADAVIFIGLLLGLVASEVNEVMMQRRRNAVPQNVFRERNSIDQNVQLPRQTASRGAGDGWRMWHILNDQ